MNQTLPRTIITAGVTFLAVLALYLFGGDVLKGFAFTMLVGIITSTYSTIFIASAVAIVLSPAGLRRGTADRRRRQGRQPRRAGPRPVEVNLVAAAVLGVVQGLTEFLPVSSSAHLILGARCSSAGIAEAALGKAFDVACHVGTLLGRAGVLPGRDRGG